MRKQSFTIPHIMTKLFDNTECLFSCLGLSVNFRYLPTGGKQINQTLFIFIQSKPKFFIATAGISRFVPDDPFAFVVFH